MGRSLRNASTLVIGLLGVIFYGLAVHGLASAPRATVVQEMQVALPRFIQVALAAGDRYLAANLAGFRVLVADTQYMRPENYQVQARLQSDIAWLNPGHEDNYYIASAILPWNGQLAAAQYVLRMAIDGRPTDWAPGFYYAFNLYHFDHDPAGAARWLIAAAERTSNVNDAMALQNVAARWFEKGYQPAVAATVVDAMAERSRSGGFKKYLHQRATRIRDLGKLQAAAESYRERFGKPLVRLDDLVGAGLIPALPVDPLGLGFAVDAEGRPFLRTMPQQASQ
jgi:hypothetical protein